MTVPQDWNDIRLTAIVPVYNEAATIESVVKRLHQVPLEVEIVAVNDGSTDGTGEILDRLLSEGEVQQVVHQPENRGKGARQ